MANKLELLQEANRRGILPPDKVAILEELQRRGVTQQPAQEEMGAVEKLGRFGTGYSPLPSKEKLAKFGEAVLELGPAFGELFVGGVQRGAEILGQEDFSRRLGEQVAKEREGLTTAQKAGRVAGKVLATAPIGFGGGALGLARAGAATAALEPTKEGTAEAAVKQTLAGAGTAAILGGVVGQAKKLGQEAFKRVKSGIGAKNVEALQDATIALKTKASNTYGKLKKLNSDISQKAGNRIVTNLDETLLSSGKLNKKLHGSTLSVVDDIRADAKAGQISIEGLDQHRMNLNAVIQKDTDSISGKVGPDGQKATVLIEKLDDLIDNLKPSDLGVGKTTTQALEARSLLNEARKDWRVYSKFQRIANLAEKADGDPNRIKALFQQFVSKKKNLKGFTPDEIKSLKFAAANTGGEKLLKTFGKFGFDFGSSATAGNTALPALSLFTGGITGAPIGGGLAVTGGTVARQLQKLVARGKVDDALALIQQGGVNPAEAISKIKNQKVREELLTRLFALPATQQITEE